MSKSAIVHARIEPHTKVQAEAILSRLGMTPTEAIRIFYRQISLVKGMPFPLKIPNRQTRKTLNENAQNKNIQHFDSLEALFKSWVE
jgi:DNA-damage-inducible protein J